MPAISMLRAIDDTIPRNRFIIVCKIRIRIDYFILNLNRFYGIQL